MSRTRAFTLIEVLVVVAIMAVLSGMLMPVLALARLRAMQSNTLALTGKVETALHLFKGELDTFPYQKHALTADFPAADNRLAWVLAHDLDAGEHEDLQRDLAAARAAYGPGGAHAIGRSEVDPRITGKGGKKESRDMHAMLVNRLGSQRASLAVMAGNTGLHGIHHDAGRAVLVSPRSRGYAFDFLSTDLAPGDISGDSIVDAWGRPLLYNCPVVQGMRGVYPAIGIMQSLDERFLEDLPPVDPPAYGLTSQGRAPTAVLDSDQRSTANPAYCDAFELWSAGPDGHIDPMRSAAANRDNLAATAYGKGLR
jgi:prepilin-type N-terminal cleavage/methylation domain-containing protein